MGVSQVFDMKKMLLALSYYVKKVKTINFIFSVSVLSHLLTILKKKQKFRKYTKC